MKTSEVFTLAKRRLSTDGGNGVGSLYICIAIEDAIDDKDWDAAEKARAIVQQRLGKHYTLGEWLRAKHHIRYSRCKTDEACQQFRNKLQVTRHAWVDSMIAEFAAIGD